MFECLWSKIGQRNFENLVTNDLESDPKSWIWKIFQVFQTIFKHFENNMPQSLFLCSCHVTTNECVSNQMFGIDISNYGIKISYLKDSNDSIFWTKQLSKPKIELLFSIYIMKFDKGTSILFRYNKEFEKTDVS